MIHRSGADIAAVLRISASALEASCGTGADTTRERDKERKRERERETCFTAGI
jgi:hypothetical protein